MSIILYIFMNKKGSILIWTMFTMLFIVSFFIVYQSWFLSFLWLTETQSKINDDDIKLWNEIIKLQWNPLTNLTIWNYNLVSKDYDWMGFSSYIPMWYVSEFRIVDPGSLNLLDINVKNWWPIAYEVISFDSSNPSSAAIYDSWTISVNWTLNIDSNKVNIIWLRCAWSDAEVYLNRWNSWLLSEYNSYDLFKNYWSWKKYIRSIEVTNFSSPYSWVDYSKFKIFLNSTNYGK